MEEQGLDNNEYKIKLAKNKIAKDPQYSTKIRETINLCQ